MKEMAKLNDEILYYKERIKELEKKVYDLRLSRLILMDMLESVEKRRQEEIKDLLKQNRILREKNQQYVKTIWSLRENCK